MRFRFALPTAMLLACALTSPACNARGSAEPAATAPAQSAATAQAHESVPAPAPAPTSGANGVSFEKAIFAGGCFWCEETAFEGLPGVQSVISGYTGGFKKNPTYEEVSAGGTGHAESVEVTYDPRKITYVQLLDLFWHNVDPTQSNGQFCDHGTQYRSAIFYRDTTQKRLAEQSKRLIETTPHRFKEPIVTQIVAASVFYPAEGYHQDFYKKDPVRYQSYRLGCGRDLRLTQLWGKPGRHGHAP